MKEDYDPKKLISVNVKASPDRYRTKEPRVSLNTKNNNLSFLMKKHDKFKDLFLSEILNLSWLLFINLSFYLKNGFKKIMRFSLKNHIRFQNFKISKIFKIITKNDEKENFCFSSKKVIRFCFFIFFKILNLSTKINKNLSFFFILNFQKFFGFFVKTLLISKILNFSEILNLSLKNTKNQNFCFLL